MLCIAYKSLRQLIIQLYTNIDIKVKWLSYPHLKQGLYVQFSSILILLGGLFPLFLLSSKQDIFAI